MKLDYTGLLGRTFKFYGVDNNCFKLDDKIYEAMEDEQDDYRSSLDALELRNNGIFSRVPLAEVCVVDTEFSRYDDDEYDDIQGFQLVDTKGHVWLTVGTNEYDGYYPCFVFRYSPPGA